MNFVSLLWMLTLGMYIIASANVFGRDFHMVGLVPDDKIVVFADHDPTKKWVQDIYSVENNVALIGDKLRSLSPHPSGGVEFITYKYGAQDILWTHLSLNGQILSECNMRNYESLHQGPTNPQIIDVRSSPQKDLLAIVRDRKLSQTETLRSVSVVEFDDEPIAPPESVTEFQMKYNTSHYRYEYVEWMAQPDTLIYTDASGIIMYYTPFRNEHREICTGEFLGLVPGTSLLFIRQSNGNFALCRRDGSEIRQIEFAKPLRNKEILGIFVLPGGNAYLMSTPRFLPLIEDALWFWRSSLNGSDYARLGGARRGIWDLCFASDY